MRSLCCSADNFYKKHIQPIVPSPLFAVMKFLSVFLVGLMLFLSFNGTARPGMAPAEKPMCCNKMHTKTGKPACHDQKSENQANNCNKQGCSMMLTCSICGFLAVEKVQIQPSMPNYIPQPVPLYKIGDITAYHTSDWKPPKAC